MSFIDFVNKNNLKNKATSKIQIQQILRSMWLDNVGIYLRDGPFSSDIGKVNSHSSKGTHWVAYVNENYFFSYACSPASKLFKFIR